MSMSSLLTLLSQQQPRVPTRRALILCGLQNDFLASDGKLPVRNGPDFLDSLRLLVPAFREHGDIIWVRSRFEANREVVDAPEPGDNVIAGHLADDISELAGDLHDANPERALMARVAEGYPGLTEVNEEDRELFLSQTVTKEPCCMPGSRGAEYGDQIRDLIDDTRDFQIVKTYYSAFGSTSLLMSLRSRFITELFIGGCITNLSVFATAMDAARYGLRITLVEDCLGYRRKDRHDVAISQLRSLVAAQVSTSAAMLAALRGPRGLQALENNTGFESNDVGDIDGEGADGFGDAVLTLLPPRASHRQPESRVPQVRDTHHSHEKISQQMYASPKGIAATESLSGKPGRSIDASKANTRTVRDSGAHVLRHHRKTSKSSEEYFRERSAKLIRRPLFGEDSVAASGGSYIAHDLLPPEVAADVFRQLRDEVNWQKMTHQTGDVPRLVCCQGTVEEDGSTPVYRHPSDRTLQTQQWTPIVEQIRLVTESVVGHALNHALIQLYRGGTDFISEHSDKTLDITRGTYIVNVSFGAQRTMRFRTKRHINAAAPSLEDISSAGHAAGIRTTFRVPMPHNSVIAVSPPTNAQFLHGIKADRRPLAELSEAEQSFNSHRISLTFRNIGTFLDRDSTCIWGQGATAKTRESARPIIDGNLVESERLIHAFGRENQESTVDWVAIYGKGFDVLHLTSI